MTESAETSVSEASVAQELVAPPREVTVMEDRARVTRRGTIQIGAGRQRLRVKAVAPVLVDKTLVVVAQSEESELRVVDARVLRKIVNDQVAADEGEEAREDAARARELRAERLTLESEIEALAAELARGENRARSLLRTSRLTMAEAVEDVSYGRTVSDALDAQLADLREHYLQQSETLVDKRADLEEMQETLERLDERIAKSESPSDREWAGIEIDLESKSACNARIQIDYAVPGACWRPYHRARLVQGESTKVEFRTDACVWQNTGEDWPEVELRFSTERSSLGVEPPTLKTDILNTQRKSAAVHIEAREQVVESLAEEGAGPAGAVARPELPGIDDGGLTLDLHAEGKCAIPSDGRPHRLFLSQFEAQAKSELVAMPELHASVLLATSLENVGELPLLAGPVDLLRESGLIGRTKVLYVASGESFELGWGPVADLRVRREVEQSAETGRALSAWNQTTHTVKVKLSNLGQEAYRMRVVERVPVSEIDKLKIDVDKKATTGGKSSDANGFVEWTVDLASRAHEDIELSYIVKKHDDVVG